MTDRISHQAARARRCTFALALAALAAGALAFVAPPFAAAETPTTQASYYGLDWVPYIDPGDLPPMAARPVVCIVDTGVAVTPDLPAADLNSNIVGRIATDGSSGLPSSTAWPTSHGSTMATYAFAAMNSWGQTGIFPQGRFLSVRANVNSPGSIDYPSGLKSCRTFAGSHNLPIAAASLSLGSDGIDTGILLADELQRATNNNYSVVAAAGNAPGPVNSPANAAGVFTAAAGVVGGSLCSYAAYGPQVEIIGPSCNIVDVDPFDGTSFTSDSGGSSMATVVTSATIALLRTLKLSSSAADVQGWIAAGATVVDGKPVLNGLGAMNAAGLSDVVVRAKARQAAALTTNPNVAHPPPSTARTESLRTPRAHVRFSRRSVRIRASNRPYKAKVEITLVFRKSEFVEKRVKRSRSRSSITIRSKRRPFRVRIRYIKGKSVSPTISFRHRRNSTFVQMKSASAK